ncbi:MAG: B12-binding domain-containing radical SAM protein [Ignavibacteria bacterium]|nr:B12-binding domain-containing radical SAM protein [Ignavibacteria bacterium]
MKILLVANPKMYFGVDLLFRIPNLGLCSLAANINRKENDVKVVDLIVSGKNPLKYFSKLIKDYSPDLVGFTCMAFQYSDTMNYVKYLKHVKPNIITVLGGYYPTVDYETIIQSQDIDYIDFIIIGEGEISFNRLIDSLNGKRNFSDISGLIFKDGKNVIINKQTKLANLEEINLPDRSVRLLRKGFYCSGYKADAVETSRGCVYDCGFCCINRMYGKNYRKFSLDRVIADIKNAQKFGAEAIMFSDDNITLDGNRFLELCYRIKDEKLNNIKYLVQASVNGIIRTPKLPEAMRQAGIEWVFLGIENANNSMLSFINKDSQLNPSDTEEVVKSLNRNNIITIGGFILGYPDDTEETLRYNFEFAKRIGVAIPIFNTLTPYPNTKVREELLKQNLITNLNDYSRYDCWEVNIRTKYLTTEQIYKIRHELEARYPIEYGTLKELIKRYPLFMLKMLWRFLTFKPRDLYKYFTGAGSLWGRRSVSYVR